MKIRYSGTTLHHATVGAAGFDVMSRYDTSVPCGGMAVPIRTGLFLEIPAGSFGLLCSRSGLVAHHGVSVANAPGIIDSDYRGEIVVLMKNVSTQTKHIQAGERIAQLVFLSHTTPEFERVTAADMSLTGRGDGGFGSTGGTTGG